MAFRDFGAPGNAAASYTVTLTLTVDNAEALWAAAAERAMRAPGMTLADVLDTIGPREDPSIGDCIALLAQPQPIAGCGLDNFGVRESLSGVPAQLLTMPMPDRHSSALLSAANG